VKPKIAKTLTGKFVVKYRCPKCEDKLVSPLDEIGLKDTCPNCNTKYVVPGQAEKAELAKRQEAARDAAARKKAEKIAAAEKAAKESSENATQETNAESITRRDSKPSTNLIACPDCGRMVSPRAQTCLECGAPISQQSPTRAKDEPFSHSSPGHGKLGRQEYHRDQLICTNCGTIGKPKIVTKGKFAIELVLWIFCCLLGELIYTIWRNMTKSKRCRSCGSATMLSLDSPMGQKLLAEFGHGV